MTTDMNKEVTRYVRRLIDYGKGAADPELDRLTLGETADRIIAIVADPVEVERLRAGYEHYKSLASSISDNANTCTDRLAAERDRLAKAVTAVEAVCAKADAWVGSNTPMTPWGPGQTFPLKGRSLTTAEVRAALSAADAPQPEADHG